MRPVSLKIEGFTSFKKEVDIDFSGLEVFAITGDNGAGKSSILEAILFALYGRTHRLGTEKKELVSLGSDRFAVSFEFESGGNRYRVTRSFKQKGNPFMKLELLKEGGSTTLAEQAQVNDAIEKLLRLPFDAFIKAVLIPQGHFDALLKPHQPRDRRKTLIELFDLGVYDRMKTRANEIVRRAEGEEFQILQQFQSRFADATPENRKELSRKKKEETVLVKDLRKQKVALEKQLTRAQEVVTLRKEHADAGDRMSRLRERLEVCTKAVSAAKETLGQTTELERREAPALEKELLQLAGTAERLQSLAQKETALEAVEKTLAASRQRRTKLEAELQQQDTRGKELAERAASLQERLSSLGFDEAVFELLQSAYEEIQHVRELKQKRDKASAVVRRETPELRRLRRESESLTGKKIELENRLEKAVTESERIRREAEILDLQLHTHPGDDCPVCGVRVSEPIRVSEKRSREIVDIRDAAERGVKQLGLDLREIELRLSKGAAEIELRERALKEEEAQAAELAASLSKAEAQLAERLRLPAGAEVDEAALELYRRQKSLSTEARSLQSAIRDADRETTGAEKQRQETVSRMKVLAAEMELQEKERNGIATDLRELKSRIGVESKEDASVRDILSATESRRKDVARSLEEIRKARGESEVSLARLQQDESHAREALAEVEKSWRQMEKKVKALSAGEVEFSDLFVETLVARLRTVSDETARKDRYLQELERDLQEMERLMEEAKEQTERLAAVRNEKEVYGLLFKHLAGNQLQDYVVSALLEQLMGSANHFLKDLTQGRYLLDLEKDSFVVMDSWASGQSRVVETLSGGESFVVSLALALALSDFMKGGAVLESLFIDEGFGSLHRDKLDLVYEALGALSGAGRVIGLVTHIEELAARFPARLHVSNTAAGSEVRLVLQETVF